MLAEVVWSCFLENRAKRPVNEILGGLVQMWQKVPNKQKIQNIYAFAGC